MAKARVGEQWTCQISSGSSVLWSKTSSESSALEPNLEREVRLGAKPGAGALIWSQTSNGSAFEVQNLEREL